MKEHFERLVDHMIAGGFFLDEAVELLEKTMIQRTLDREKGNRCAASRALGIHRNTLQRKIEQYGLERKPPARFRGGVGRKASAG